MFDAPVSRVLGGTQLGLFLNLLDRRTESEMFAGLLRIANFTCLLWSLLSAKLGSERWLAAQMTGSAKPDRAPRTRLDQTGIRL